MPRYCCRCKARSRWARDVESWGEKRKKGVGKISVLRIYNLLSWCKATRLTTLCLWNLPCDPEACWRRRRGLISGVERRRGLYRDHILASRITTACRWQDKLVQLRLLTENKCKRTTSARIESTTDAKKARQLTSHTILCQQHTTTPKHHNLLHTSLDLDAWSWSKKPLRKHFPSSVTWRGDLHEYTSGNVILQVTSGDEAGR